MTAQEENELIAERLLGWEHIGGIRWDDGKGGCGPAVDERFFSDWAGRGLIIDALQAQWPLSKQALQSIAGCILLGNLDEADVRASALAYLKSTP